jgi:hypothetical protein
MPTDTTREAKLRGWWKRLLAPFASALFMPMHARLALKPLPVRRRQRSR